MRVLHVVGGMNRGGVETWLMHVLRSPASRRFHMDFLVHTNAECAYDKEIEAAGSSIYRCAHTDSPRMYSRALKRILAEHGPFDVVHSHVHHFSGHVLKIANEAGVPIRIAHSHSDTLRAERGAGIRRRAYLALMERWIRRYATAGIGASEQAAAALFGPRWRDNPRCRISYCGVDLEPFRTRPDRSEVRAELGIPEDALVLGHVGGFRSVKNHTHLLDIAAECIKKHAQTYLLLIGDGPLRADIEAQARALGITDNVVITGFRPDVPRLLMGAVDVFVFPSLYEGLPLSVVEAQAAGLHAIVSDTVTPEVDVVPGAITWLPVNAPAERWADACLSNSRPLGPESFATVQHSPFEIQASIESLVRVYETPTPAARKVTTLH